MTDDGPIAEANSVIRVLSANGVKAVVGDLAPRFSEATGIRLAVHFAEVLRTLGIADAIAPRLILTRGALNAALVARGEADLAVQLAHEIHAVAGIDFVPMPHEFTRTITFSAGLPTAASRAAIK